MRHAPHTMKSLSSIEVGRSTIPPRLIVDPPGREWRLGAVASDADRTALVACVNRHADRLGLGRVRHDGPIIATGHQAWFWHPGILAKDVAISVAAERFAAGMVHIVVDQDVHEALTMEVPVREGDRLSVRKVRLGDHDATLPTGAQPPAELVFADLPEPTRSRFAAAFRDMPPCRTLAEQITVLLGRLMTPYAGHVPVVFATELLSLPQARDMVARMRDDAAACAAAYNRAVAMNPEAGIAPLTIERDRVELPLWLMRWGRPRVRVYADVSDSAPLLVDEQGEMIDAASSELAPRALMLTAVMRRWCCDLFIHGKGGGVYDTITERWLADWLGATLAPMAVVSADLYLDFAVPLAQRADVHHAVWRAHHLRHNLDRELPDAIAADRKRALLAAMDASADRRERYGIFKRIHAINDDLAQRHAGVLTDADRAVQAARTGAENRAIAARRDWSFVVYPDEALHTLRDRFAAEAGVIGQAG